MTATTSTLAPYEKGTPPDDLRQGYSVIIAARWMLVAAGLLLLFAPAAYFSVQFMRWWARILSLSQRPAFQRAR